MDERLAAVQAKLAGELGDGVVRDGQDDELRIVEQRRRLGERANARYERTEPLAPRLIPGSDGHDRPAGTMERRAERRAHGSRADDPDQRRLAGLRVAVRVLVCGLARPVVMAGPRRVEVDPGAAQLVHRGRPLVRRQRVPAARRRRAAVLARPSARAAPVPRSPGLHAAAPRGPGVCSGYPFIVSSLASVEVAERGAA